MAASAKRSLYAEKIDAVIRAGGQDPEHVSVEHVEAWMRLERGTLDSLSPETFAREARIAIGCVLASTKRENDALAQTYGLLT